MKTFSIEIAVTGKVTVTEALLQALRQEALQSPEDGGDKFMHETSRDNPDDDVFLRLLLRNSLRTAIRAGLATDLSKMGLGVRLAPAGVDVSVPERVITMVKERAAGVPAAFGAVKVDRNGREVYDQLGGIEGQIATEQAS